MPPMLTSRSVHRRCFLIAALAFANGFLLTACSTPARPAPRTQLRSFDRFEAFERTQRGNDVVWLSPRVGVLPWDELIVSWNGHCPAGTSLQVEARAFDGEHATRFYTIARWSAEVGKGRTSLENEPDADAAVETDTMMCRRLMNGAQVRITLSAANDIAPQLKLVTFSFLNSTVAPPSMPMNRAAWGKTLEVPQRSQLGHPGASGWCSPTALSMLLAHWAQRLHRPELDVPVPEVARCVYDTAYGGTGNWIFNAAYAGGFQGMRAYATRFDNFRQVEDCIAAGIPLALSVSFDLLNGKEQDQNNGHLIVVAGFTASGDVVANDPWPNPKKENRVRKIFPRERVIAAWQRSKQTVYLVFPESVRAPR